MSTPKPSDLPRTLLQAARDQHTDSLTAAIEDTQAVFNIFHNELGHNPMVSAILTHAALSNQILED